MDCFAIYTKLSDLIPPIAFKSSFLLSDLLADKLLAALYHDNETEAVAVHISQVLFAEISPVKHEADVLISVAFHLFDHELEL